MHFIIMTIIIVFGTLFIIKITYILSTVLVMSTTKGALFVSTPRKRIQALLDAIPIKKGQVLIDLGCGDGRILRMARKHNDITAIGYELNPMAYLKAWLLSIGKKGIHINRSDFWSADLSRADIIVCYLFPDLMTDLSIKLTSDLKKGAIIVSCNFPLKGFNPINIIHPKGALNNDPIYIYCK